MPLFTIILALVAVGVLLWLIHAYVPLDPPIKRILQIVVVCVVVVWLLKVFGVWSAMMQIHV